MRFNVLKSPFHTRLNPLNENQKSLMTKVADKFEELRLLIRSDLLESRHRSLAIQDLEKSFSMVSTHIELHESETNARPAKVIKDNSLANH